MAINTLPPGWKPPQLQALNDLVDLIVLLDHVRRARLLVADDTTEGAQVERDILGMVNAKWPEVCNFK